MVTTTTGLATSFIQFSRTSNATVTGADGKIKWAGHNLLTNSESFDASAWTKSSATVTANTDPAPNGTTTGDTVAASGANGTALQTWTAEAVPYTFGVWLRRKTGTGSIQIAADSGTYTTVTITSSWALYTVTQTPAAGSKSAGIRIVTSGDEVYAWGAHLYRSDLGGMVLNPARGDAYYPTTPRNAVGYSEDLANAGWTKDNILAFGSGSISNAATAPNGLQTADLIVPNTTSGYHYLNSNQFTLGVGCHSIYVKPAGYTKFGLRSGAYAEAAFNLTGSGTVLYSNASLGATLSSVAVVALSDGWYRVSYVLSGAVNNRIEAWVLPDSYTTGTIVSNWTPNGTSGIYLWGAQLSDSASLDAYSPVYGAAVTSAAYYAPRLDFDANGSALGLLVEEQRTNLLQRTAEFDDAYWTKTSLVTAGMANAGIGPDGSLSADKLIEDTTASTSHYATRSGITVSASTPHTFSVYLKSAGRNFAVVQLGSAYAWFNLSTGVVGTSVSASTGTFSILSVGSGWYRCNVTWTTTSTTTFATIYTASADNVFDYTGDGTSGVLVWGAQLEAGSFATSYIPTGAATATRTADVASVSTQAFPYSSTAGTVIASYTERNQAIGSYVFSLDNGTVNDITDFRTSGYFSVFRSGSLQTQGTVTGLNAVGVSDKIALAATDASFGAVANGGTVVSASSGQMPAAASTLRLGSSPGVNFINGHIRQITYIPRRLSNSELQQRTSV